MRVLIADKLPPAEHHMNEDVFGNDRRWVAARRDERSALSSDSPPTKPIRDDRVVVGRFLERSIIDVDDSAKDLCR